MENKRWLIPVAIIVAVFVLGVIGIGTMVSKGYGISTGLYLEAKDGQALFIRDNSPIEMSNRSERVLFDNLDVGDKILVIHDGIEETYPGRTGVYAVFKLSEGTTGDIPQTVVMQLITLGWLETKEESEMPSDAVPGGAPADEIFDITVSYANWGDLNAIYTKALNIDTMVISSVRHLPIYKFDTLAELEQFKNDVKDVLSIDQSYSEVPSFNESTAKYDEKFFAENTLMLVYVEASSGSCRYGVDSVYHADGNFCIHVKQTNNPEEHTDDMAGWFITVAVPDSMVADCTVFDADFHQ